MNIKKIKDEKLKKKKNWKEKEALLKLEKDALKKNERLDVLDNILKQVQKITALASQKFGRNTNFLYKEKTNQSILDYILEAGWKNTHTTGSL